MTRNCPRFAALLPTLLTFAAVMPASSYAETWSYLMYSDPKLVPYRAPEEIPHEVMVVWQSSLEQADDDELLAVVGFDIVKAHTSEAIDLRPLLPTCLARFRDTASHVVRANMARVLTSLATQEDATEEIINDLIAAADEDINIATLVEPALARWNYQPRREHWRRQIVDVNQLQRRRLLAVESLSEIQDSASRDMLLQLAEDVTTPGAIRLAAASAAAHCDPEADDPLELAKQIMPKRLGKWVAVRLLSMADQEASLPVLRELAQDPDLGVAFIAAKRLAQRWPQELVRLGEKMRDHPSGQVRLTTVQCIGEHGGDGRPQLLGPYLSDRHPEVRSTAGAELVELGKLGMLEAVQEQVRLALQGDKWQGHAQACRVADELAYVEASPLVLKLQSSTHYQTRTAAAFFLGRHLPAEDMRALDVHIDNVLQLRRSNDVNYQWDEELLLLLQAYGRTKHRAGDEMLRKFIPKSVPFAPIIRAAAIWSLGKIYEGQAPEDLGATLADRLNDVNSMIPESPDVRGMCAISIARMNCQKQREDVLRYQPSKTTRVGLSLAWSIEKFTGEVPEMPRPWRRVKMNFNIFPLLQYFEP